jgi:mono/diheme cytochrome c family protein
MKFLKKLFIIPASLLLLLSFVPFNNSMNLISERIVQDSTKWVAPESADKMINPFESNEENIAKAMPLYKRLCRSCHGRLGDGQGVEAEDLESVTTDFTDPSFLEQTDGSMYWKIAEGRNDMESFKEKLNEEEIWLLVLYIKTFSTE